ncbi:MAG: hypothetical protein M1470_06145 [Bacteroidetes bacterium]|nr:hypothetical protein [Bacteroidota bacterium]MCL5738291.1 hypothetical protein [Bacteroidota bacterium]
MENRKQEIRGVFTAFLRTLEQLTEEELNQLASGEGTLQFVPRKPSKKNASQNRLDPRKVQDIAAELQRANTREEAREILHRDPAFPKMGHLVELAKYLKVHVIKHDNREDVENKIIEFVVGAKLRSEAIQGLNLKGHG